MQEPNWNLHNFSDFIGYSMGTTQYLMLLSEKPEYNSKIRSGTKNISLVRAIFCNSSSVSAYLMGPAGSLGQGSKLLKFMANFADEVLPLLGLSQLSKIFEDSTIPMDCLSSSFNRYLCRRVR